MDPLPYWRFALGRGSRLKPSRFVYHVPATVDEAVGLLAEHADSAKVLAGGQSLVTDDVAPLGVLRAPRRHQPGRRHRQHRASQRRRSGRRLGPPGAGRTRSDRNGLLSADDEGTAPHRPFPDPQPGTVCGSLAHADPASELPAVALALDATLEAAGPAGPREIPAAEFFESTWQTTLGEDELLVAVRFPVWDSSSGFAVEEVARRLGDFAICGAACAVTLDGDRVARAAIALFGVAATPVRANAAELALMAGGAGSDFGLIGREAAAPLTPLDDLHASGAYRKHVVVPVVRRALARAIEEARA